MSKLSFHEHFEKSIKNSCNAVGDINSGTIKRVNATPRDLAKTVGKPEKCVCCKSILPSEETKIHRIFGASKNAALIQRMLTHFLQRTVVESVGTKQGICDNCLVQLKQSYAFKIKCLESDVDVEEEESMDEPIKVEPDREFECSEENFPSTVAEDDNEQKDDSTDEQDDCVSHACTDVSMKVNWPECPGFEDHLLTRNSSFTQCLDVRLIKIYLRQGIRVQQGCRSITITTDGAVMTKLKRRRPALDEELDDRMEETIKRTDNVGLDVDQYIMALASIHFGKWDEWQAPQCCYCATLITSFGALSEHSASAHYNESDGTFRCCLFDTCKPMDSWVDLQNHWYSEHRDVINCFTYLICTTCNQPFESAVMFGKHICTGEQKLNTYDKKLLFCSECSKQFVSLKRFLFHTQFHLPEARPKVCLVCELQYADDKQFYEHVMFAHEVVATFFCRYCDRTFFAQSELDAHGVKHKKYVCSQCDMRFPNGQCLNSHKAKHGNGYFCDYCGCKYMKKYRLSTHIRLFHTPQEATELSVCAECDQVFANEHLAHLHVRHKHRIDPEANSDSLTRKLIESVVLCEFCEAAFETYDSLTDHKAKHADGPLRYECVHCPSKYDQYGKLKTHFNSHTKLKAMFPVKSWFACDHCPKRFRIFRACQVHRRNIHTRAAPVIACDLCTLGFQKIVEYENHRKAVHSGERPRHKCAKCERTFSVAFDMRKHFKRVHVENRPTPKRTKYDGWRRVNADGTVTCLKCDHVAKSHQMLRIHFTEKHDENAKVYQCYICKKICGKKQTLKEHMATHDAVKPFECHICKHQLCSKTQLNYHLKTHSSNRSFACDQCPKTYKLGAQLRVHKALHLGIQHICPICNKSFASKNSLYCHRRRGPCTEKGINPEKYVEYVVYVDEQHDIHEE